MQDQHQKFESTLQSQYQKETEEIKSLKKSMKIQEKNIEETIYEMATIYNELKVKHQKETKNSHQLQKKNIKADKTNFERSHQITEKLNLNQSRLSQKKNTS